MLRLCLIVSLALSIAGPLEAQEQQPMSDAEVRTLMVQESIRAYSGPCPCPYNQMRNGRRCGKFSAYSKPGGEEPHCYGDEISDQEVDRYRRARGIPRRAGA